MKKSPFPTNISLYLGNDASRDFLVCSSTQKKHCSSKWICAVKQHHLTLPEAADLAQNPALWCVWSMSCHVNMSCHVIMSTYGAMQSWVACQKRWRRRCTISEASEGQCRTCVVVGLRCKVKSTVAKCLYTCRPTEYV